MFILRSSLGSDFTTNTPGNKGNFFYRIIKEHLLPILLIFEYCFKKAEKKVFKVKSSKEELFALKTVERKALFLLKIHFFMPTLAVWEKLM